MFNRSLLFIQTSLPLGFLQIAGCDMKPWNPSFSRHNPCSHNLEKKKGMDCENLGGKDIITALAFCFSSRNKSVARIPWTLSQKQLVQMLWSYEGAVCVLQELMNQHGTCSRITSKTVDTGTSTAHCCYRSASVANPSLSCFQNNNLQTGNGRTLCHQARWTRWAFK